jgi:hypothetical protein
MFTNLWTVKLSDWQRALIVAILTTPITIIYDAAVTGGLAFDWRKILAGAIAGGAGYLLKNLLTGTGGNLLTNK